MSFAALSGRQQQQVVKYLLMINRPNISMDSMGGFSSSIQNMLHSKRSRADYVLGGIWQICYYECHAFAIFVVFSFVGVNPWMDFQDIVRAC